MTMASNDRLVHYLSAALSATPKTAPEICLQATADPRLHMFGELLSTPAIAALQSTPDAKYFNLLRLFAYGIVQDYESNPQIFPPLTDDHWRKLRALTLITLANGNNLLYYEHLREKLSLSRTRELEDVVIDAVYAGLIRARMNPFKGTVEISAAVGRDVIAPGGIAAMTSILTSWVNRSSQLVAEIDDKINYIASHTLQAKEHKARAIANAKAVKRDVVANRMHTVAPENDDFDFLRQMMSIDRDGEGRSIRSRFET